MLDKYKDYIWLTCLLGCFAGLWYHYWVKPNDATMNEIMQCMGEDRTREVFEECRVLVKGE